MIHTHTNQSTHSAHSILDNLGAKLVHFLVDYHHDWFASLDLEKSDGRHKQLDGVEVQDVLVDFSIG